jgi:hypothetical protein
MTQFVSSGTQNAEKHPIPAQIASNTRNPEPHGAHTTHNTGKHYYEAKPIASKPHPIADQPIPYKEAENDLLAVYDTPKAYETNLTNEADKRTIDMLLKDFSEPASNSTATAKAKAIELGSQQPSQVFK